MKKIITTILILCSLSIVQAQKQNDTKKDKENLLVQLQEGANPIIYVDGKVFDFPMELIDQSKIASVMVVKEKEAKEKYNAPNGVVIITTKKADNIDFSDTKLREDQKLGAINGPKVIIDGKVANKKQLDKMTPSIVKTMKIIKGEKALKNYNAPNGVVIITTKKEK